MVDVRRLPVGDNDEVTATLGELARERARRMIAAALEAEVEQSSACFALSDADRELVFAQRGAARPALPTFPASTTFSLRDSASRPSTGGTWRRESTV